MLKRPTWDLELIQRWTFSRSPLGLYVCLLVYLVLKFRMNFNLIFLIQFHYFFQFLSLRVVWLVHKNWRSVTWSEYWFMKENVLKFSATIYLLLLYEHCLNVSPTVNSVIFKRYLGLVDIKTRCKGCAVLANFPISLKCLFVFL